MDWINEEGGFNAEAADMPEGVKSLVDAKGYKGVTDLAEAYTNAQSKLGVAPERLVAIPEKPDDADGWSQVYTKLGRPETPDAYKPEVKVHDGQELSPELVKEFSTVAHEIGLTNTQVSKIMQYQVDLSHKYTEMSAAEAAEAEKVAAADAMNAHNKAVNDFMVQNSIKTEAEFKEFTGGLEETSKQIGFYDLINEAGHGDDPKWLAALAKLRGQLSDSVTLDEGSKVDLRSKEERINAIVNNPAFVNVLHPEHAKLKREYDSIFGIAG